MSKLRTIMLAVATVAAAGGIVWVTSASGWLKPATATGPDSNVIVTVDTVGIWTSLALDSNGYPVVSYYDDDLTDLKILHCASATCASANSIETPDPAGDPSGDADNVGQYTSLVLDGNGFPVVSHYDATNDDLKVLHCNDVDCAGGDDSVTSPDTGGNVGQWNSLALDATGNPVVSYALQTGGDFDLKVLHCNDPNCEGGDESITSPDTSGSVGTQTSLALDADGNPVVSYLGGAIRVLHCGDPDCGPGGVISSPAPMSSYPFSDTALALDGAGNPVVSYLGPSGTFFDTLNLLHCNDPYCVGDDESVTVPDSSAQLVGQWSSLVLDSSGNPVVSYHQNGGASSPNYDLKVLRCDDANCAPGGDTIAVPEPDNSAGSCTSLALDDKGNPVVSYHANGNLKVLHCSDPFCEAPPPPTATPTHTATPTATATTTPTATPSPTPTKQLSPGDTDGDGCTDEQENGPDHTLGGQRDYLNFWDFFDVCTGEPPIRDRQVFGQDISAIVARFGESQEPPPTKEEALTQALTPPADSGYHAAYDRTPLGPDVWNLGPPDGSIFGQDIGLVVAQFGDTCA